MTLGAVEARFGGPRAPDHVEMLSDDGLSYSDKDTHIFASQSCLDPCDTPVKRRQSNGISEAFIHSLKQDHVSSTPLLDAVLGSIVGGFEDCNENHSHPGSNIRSPREFIAAQTVIALERPTKPISAS